MPSMLYVQQIVTQVFTPHTKTKMKAYRSFATTVSQLKISDFSGETIKGFKVLYFYDCKDDTTALQRRVLQTAL